MSAIDLATRNDAARTLAADDGFTSATAMTGALDGLRARIEGQLRHAGVNLPDGELADLADEILNEAVRVALLWLGEPRVSLAPVSAQGTRRASLGA